MEKIKLSHAQMARMAKLTEGYSQKDFEFWVSAQRIVYLYVFNIVYNIDVEGGSIARRKSDGTMIGSGESALFTAYRKEV